MRQLEQKRNKSFYSRMQTKELLAHLHNSSGGGTNDNTVSATSGFGQSSNEVRRFSTRRSRRSEMELSSSAVVGTRMCASNRTSKVSDDTSSLSSSDESDSEASNRNTPRPSVDPRPVLASTPPRPLPMLSTELPTRKRRRGGVQPSTKRLTYNQRSAALFGRKAPRINNNGEVPSAGEGIVLSGKKFSSCACHVNDFHSS